LKKILTGLVAKAKAKRDQVETAEVKGRARQPFLNLLAETRQ